MSVQHESCGFFNLHAFGEIQLESTIRSHMTIDEGSERPEIFLSHLAEVPGLGQHALNQ